MNDLKVLIGKLNSTCRRGLEEAAGLCVAQTHYNVEVEHYLLKLLELPATDLELVLRHYDVDAADLQRQLERSLESFERGNGRTPAFSPQLVKLLQGAWSVASIHLDADGVRSGALLLALLQDDALRPAIVESCPVLARFSLDSLRDDLPELIRHSGEATQKATGPGRHRRAAPRERPDAGPSETPALDRYTQDLTADARAGRIDPIRGRDAEIRQVIDILTRRRQNNPILVGDAGVGKTAVAEGFAQRVVDESVPGPLKGMAVRLLDLALLQAGAGVRGEFEERLKTVISEVAGRPVILFIDEAHTLIGAGNRAGQGDAANLLKPALARGELRTIAATTWGEYKKYFEKDPALTRRFQLVKIDEPSEGAAIDMLRGLVPKLEAHHGVRILDEAVCDAVRLSGRYLAERRLPDKAISVLDTACARVALAQDGVPGALEGLERRIARTELEFDVLMREMLVRDGPEGRRRGAAADRLAEELEELREERGELTQRLQRERELVAEIHELQAELDRLRAEGDPEGELADRLASLIDGCRVFQGEEPMVPIAVDSRTVGSVIAGWTGIPAGRMLADEIHGVLALEQKMAERLVGQRQALDALCRRIRTSSAGLEDPGKPKGVFLLVGPTGVGKTETAVTLAELLYGGERDMVVVNMSEFQEAHTVASLRGSPPGYVGYGKGGVLTEAVRRRPHSVVLLDEVEKAHPDVVELFYQVFDKGVLEDGEGVPVDFKHTVILMTSNLGGEAIAEAARREPESDAAALVEAVRPRLLGHFPPALLGRVVVVPYLPLGAAVIREIVALKLEKIRQRLAANHGAALEWGASLVDEIAARCDAEQTGARTIDHLLTQTLLPDLSSRLLERMARGEPTSRIGVEWRDGEWAFVIE